MEITKGVLAAILDAYPYEVVFVDREHIVRYLNRRARERYGEGPHARVKVGRPIFACHSEATRKKIEELLARADAAAPGDADHDEIFEALNTKTGEREFFVPVRDADGAVVGYFERHEVSWSADAPDKPVGAYWERRA